MKLLFYGLMLSVWCRTVGILIIIATLDVTDLEMSFWMICPVVLAGKK